MKRIGTIITLSVVGLIIIGTFFFLWKKSQPTIQRYEIVTLKRDSIENKAVATGKIEPRDEVLIKPQISGIITHLLKEPGEQVRAGEVIARIKVIPEMVQLSQAESRVRVAKINLEQTEKVYKRQLDLHKRGVIANEEFEQSQTEYRRSKEEHENAVESLDLTREGISKRMESSSNTQVRATINGTILDIPVKVGNSVIQANTFNDGTTIATIANLGDMIFKGKVDETEIGKIKKGMPITLIIGALENQKFGADLEYISPKGVEENGAVMFEIKAAVQIPKGTSIRAGYSANAEIIQKRAAGIWTLPESCVEFSNDTSYVYVLKKESPAQEFERKRIEVGLSDGIKVEIKKGIGPKDKIRGALILEKKEEKKPQ